jgi:hypothetical protein
MIKTVNVFVWVLLIAAQMFALSVFDLKQYAAIYCLIIGNLLVFMCNEYV